MAIPNNEPEIPFVGQKDGDMKRGMLQAQGGKTIAFSGEGKDCRKGNHPKLLASNELVLSSS